MRERAGRMTESGSGKVVILGVTGSVAAYKAVYVASTLRKHGVEVDAVLTANAARFVTPLQFGSVTGRPVYMEMFSERDDIVHVSLADRASLLLVAPASANFIGKYANGIADDLLSTTAVSVDCPVLLAPAMNSRMWGHPAVQANVESLRKRGVVFVGPGEGRLACGAEGIGRLAEPGEIVSEAVRILESRK